MSATTTSAVLVPVQPVFTDAERLALAGFLAGYRGQTRDAYALDLRQFSTWCRARSLPLFAVRRADIEMFARDLEERGRARATVTRRLCTITRRLCTIAGFYRYAVEEELLEHSPAAHVRRPRLDYESHAVGLDRNELGALLVAAGLGPPIEHALISLLALTGLRVSEAAGADIEQLGRSTWPSVSAATARSSCPRAGGGWTGTARAGSSAGSPAAPGLARRSGRIRCGTRLSPRRSMPGCRCVMCRKPPPTPTRAPRCGTTGPAAAWTGTPPTSSPPTSPEQPGNPLTTSGSAGPARSLARPGVAKAIRDPARPE